MTDWAIPQQAKLKYTQLFNFHDRSRSGFLSGLQCRDILLQSGLARNILAEIWNLSDIEGTGQLTREEFILAMHLTNLVRTGQTLPKELPPDLIPPSYRRTRSISTTSVNSASSSTGASNVDDKTSLKSADGNAPPPIPGSILNSNSFEDKRRENYEKGRAELERRRLKIIEQQSSVLNEQLTACKKQVAEAKSKIDAMRSSRDTKAGLITSLEAQLKTIRDRKAYLDQEEFDLIAIAKDLNLVGSAQSAELDQQATLAKQQSIELMKEKLNEFLVEKEQKSREYAEALTNLEEQRKELKLLSETVSKTYENYKEKVAHAKIMKAQIAEENKTKPIDLDSVWDSAPTFASALQTNEPITQSGKPELSTSGFGDDSWLPSSTSPTKPSNDQPLSFTTTSPTAQNNNNFEMKQTPDYSALSNIGFGEEKFGDFNKNAVPTQQESGLPIRKKYKALYAFEARNPDELTINPGDIVIGNDEICEPGWLSGELNGKTGLFPEAYVESIQDDEQFNTSVTKESSSAILPSSIDTAFNESLSFSGSFQENVVAKYKVIYAFEARNHDELTMNPGDIVTGIEGAHEPGWLMGELNGQKGLFPEAYVEKIADASPAEPAGKSRSKRADVATVIANYRALGQEQLNLEKGQLVLIRRKMDSGWWEGEIQVKGKKKQYGWFPSSYVKLLSNTSGSGSSSTAAQ